MKNIQAPLIFICALFNLYGLHSQNDSIFVIPRNSEIVITQPNLVFDVFIMEDNSTIRLDLPEESNWTLIANETYIGENCRIIGVGKNGTDQNDRPEPADTQGICDDGYNGQIGLDGGNGVKGTNIYISTTFKELGSLLIDTRGGRGGNGGAGGRGQRGGPASVIKNCRGGTAGNGGNGGSAGEGSNGGDIIIDYYNTGIAPNLNSPRSHSISCFSSRGENGKAGNGGEGGKGGDPDDGGIIKKGGGRDGNRGNPGKLAETVPRDGMISFTSVDVKTKGEKLGTTTDPEIRNFTIGGKYYAIIMACGNYPYQPDKRLDHPIPDGKQLAKILKDRYYFEEVRFMEDPNRSDIIDTLDKYSKILNTNDNLLVFFSGHGDWLESKKQGYWKPSNSDWASTSNWISNSDIRDIIDSYKCRHVLLITDACFSGSLVLKIKGDDEILPKERQMYKLKSRKAMTSGALETVLDDSIFNKALFEFLSKNKEKYVSASAVFSHIEDVVRSKQDLTNPQYLPIINVGHDGGDFIFILKDK